MKNTTKDEKVNKLNKTENFRRLAERRVNKTLNYMRLIGNLGNRRNYNYTDSEVEKIISTLEKELDKLKMKFEPNKVNFVL